MLLATVCYLAVGPLFATPRTATVSFEVGIAPLTGDGAMPLFIYSLVYFALVILASPSIRAACWTPWATSWLR